MANLGTGLAKLDMKVCLVDADIGLRNLDLIMGLENRIVYDLVNVVEGVVELRKALVRDKRFDEKLYLLPAAQTREKDAVNEDQMRDLCNRLRAEFDFVIVDCPAGIEQGFRNAVAGADEAVIITTPEVSAVRDADRIVGKLESCGISKPKLILNRVRADMIRRNEMMSIEDVLEILAIKLLGVIPDDETIIVSANKGEPAVLDSASKAGEAYRNIVRRLLGEEVPVMPLEADRGFLARLRRVMGIRAK